MSTVRALGICGSLGKASHSLKLLETAQALLPGGMSLDIAEPLDLPLYSEEAERYGFPARVARFRESVARADAFVFATPEYNFALPAALKNALEWSSCPPDPPFAWKACAILGATSGAMGTMRAQSDLRQICRSLNLEAVSVPQLDVAEAQMRSGGAGRLIDEPVRQALRLLLNALYNLTIKITPPERLSSFRPALF